LGNALSKPEQRILTGLFEKLIHGEENAAEKRRSTR
jgi:hypothetical protein